VTTKTVQLNGSTFSVLASSQNLKAAGTALNAGNFLNFAWAERRKESRNGVDCYPEVTPKSLTFFGGSGWDFLLTFVILKLEILNLL